jgi:4-amino-4-deoxy-L-arabinose transferase-like glycosyltransferase
MDSPSPLVAPPRRDLATPSGRSRYNVTVWTACLIIFIAICLITVAVMAYLLWKFRANSRAVVSGLEGYALSAAFVALVLVVGRVVASPRSRPRTGAWMIGLFAASLAIRVACVTYLPYEPAADFKVYHEAGVNMAKHWTLGEEAANSVGGSLRCFFPPGQVFTLGVLYRLFDNSVLSAELFNCLLASLTVVGIYLIARRLLGERPGRVAGILAVFLPSTVFGCMVLGAEVPDTFWLVLALWIYLRWVDSGFAWKGAIACGLCLGIGALIRPTYLLLPIPIGLHMLLSWPGKGRAILAATVMGLSLAAVVAPWTYRNYKVTGGLVVISSNGGGNLWSGNNDATWHGKYTPKTWDWLFKNSRTDLELQQKGMAKAKEWIATHKARFAQLTLEKFALLWALDNDMAWWALEQPFREHEEKPSYPEPKFNPWWGWWAQAVSTGFYLACFAAAAVGMVWRREELWRRRGWIILAVMFFYFSAIHMVFESQAKYHYMLVPLACVFSALIVCKDDEPMPEERGA